MTSSRSREENNILSNKDRDVAPYVVTKEQEEFRADFHDEINRLHESVKKR